VCLDSPPPVRHLKEMDRLRELEGEKLGLVGKKKEGALQRDKANVITKEKKQSGWYVFFGFRRRCFFLPCECSRTSHFFR
jgi:hypothetical protein